jgi:inner membrane protein
MSPITHLLAGWTLAAAFGKTRRERFFVAAASAAPDLDGLGVVVDILSPALGGPATEWFGTWHHMLLHGLLGAALFMAAAAAAGVRRPSALGWVCVSAHLHLLMDLAGSRGPVPGETWAIHYFAPVWSEPSMFWAGQWALNGWQNFLITGVLLAWAGRVAVVEGHSPVSLFSEKWDKPVVRALRNRFGTPSQKAEPL